MKILLDESVPTGFKTIFPGHEVFTAQEVGLAGIKIGDLLAAAEFAGFNVLITCDQNMPCEQLVSGRSLAIIQFFTERFEALKVFAHDFGETVAEAVPGKFYYVTPA